MFVRNAARRSNVEGESSCAKLAIWPFRSKWSADLTSAFVEACVVPSDRPFAFAVGGEWFCPGDGRRMLESHSIVRCPECTRALNQFVHRLVELHPHHGNPG